MTKLILLPGWGLGPAALQPLVAALDAEAGLSVELAELPALTSSDPEAWLDELDATPDALRKLAETGLWREPGDVAARRAEGFNRIAIAAY